MLRRLGRDDWALAALPVLAVLLHAVCFHQYGMFRDELYYLACARRLAWGYVDHPPFFVAVVWAGVRVFGEGLLAVRLPAVLASGGTVLLAMATARRLGATGWAVWLAGLFPLLAGMYLVVFHLGTMNPVDVLLWSLAAWLAAKLFERPSPRLWMALGLLMGVGLLNKASMAWLMVALPLGILVSPHRRLLASPWPWSAAALALALWSPHIAWQAQHGWPTAEFLRNAQHDKLLPVPWWEFLAQQAVVMNVAAAPMYLLGAWWALATSEGRRWRPFAVVFVSVALFLMAMQRTRVNYLAPAYAFAFPTAAVAVQRLWDRKRWRPAWAVVPVAASGAATAPLGLPILPVETLDSFARRIPVRPPVEETGPRRVILGYADMFGWPEMAYLAYRAWKTIPPEQRARAVVVAGNYGEAAAIEHFWPGPRPAPVVSGHNNYWLWGPGDWDGQAAVFVNEERPWAVGSFESWEVLGSTGHEWAMPEESRAPVAVAYGLQEPVASFWERLRKFR